MGKKIDQAGEAIALVCVLVLMAAILCGLLKWVNVVAEKVDNTRLGQKIEYWIGDPNED